MQSPAAPLSVADRFALIIGGLRAAVAARIGYYAVTGPMIVYICNRLNKINQRFQALAALILSGKPPPERVYRRRAAGVTAVVPPRPGAEAGARDFFPVWRLVPTYRFGWLCMVAPNWAGPQYAAVWGGALRDLLTDPRMAALVAATPRMQELLRPLCWGLGIEASMLRPRPAPPDVVEPTLDPVAPGGTGIVSRGGTAPAVTDPPPAAKCPEGGFIPRFFAPA